MTVYEVNIYTYVEYLTGSISGRQGSFNQELNMFAKHTLQRSKINPSTGIIKAKVTDNPDIDTHQFNFAYNYYVTENQLRLTIRTAQVVQDASGVKTIHGLEMVFDPNISNGTHFIKDRRFYANYWYLWNSDNGDTQLATYDADRGSITLNFNYQTEIYEGSFSFESDRWDIDAVPIRMVISSGSFSFKGRDNFSL